MVAPIDSCPVYHPITFILPAAVKYNNKTITETYNDIEIVYQGMDESDTPFATPIERDIIDYEDQTYITFETQEHFEAGSSSQRYYLYYGNPNASGGVDRKEIEGQATDIPSDIPYLPSWAHWPSEASYNGDLIGYTRPSEHWVDGKSSNPNAQATINGAFSRIRVISDTDSSSGFLLYRIDNGNTQEVDTYSRYSEVRSVFECKMQNEAIQELSIFPTGYSRYQNSGASINIRSIQYATYIDVNDMGEEVKSLNWGSFLGKV